MSETKKVPYSTQNNLIDLEKVRKELRLPTSLAAILAILTRGEIEATRPGLVKVSLDPVHAVDIRIKKINKYALAAQTYIDAGELVPDDVLIRMEAWEKENRGR